MEDIKKMFRTIVNGQSSMKSELLGEVSKLRKEMSTGFTEVNNRLDNTNKRIDKLGKSLAYLEDDAPTREEFDGLGKRVGKLEQKVASV